MTCSKAFGITDAGEYNLADRPCDCIQSLADVYYRLGRDLRAEMFAVITFRKSLSRRAEGKT